MSSYSCVVAMLTYRRPDDLRAALPALLAEIGDRPATRLLIVDNEPEIGQARQIVADTPAPPDVLHYLHQPEPGISAARNAALQWCAGQDVIIFIDDDEHPQPGWLAALLDCYQRFGEPAAVAGPVISEFDGEPDDYLTAGGFFRRGNPETGTLRPAAATNNLLLKLAVLQRHGLRFDADFGITGGSDSLLTKQLLAHGERIVWCREAVVVDRVPASRMTVPWVLQKQYRQGNTTARVALRLAPSGRRPLVRARLLGEGTARLLVGTGLRAGGRLSGRLATQAGGHRMAVRGRGMAAGALGKVYSEYRRSG